MAHSVTYRKKQRLSEISKSNSHFKCFKNKSLIISHLKNTKTEDEDEYEVRRRYAASYSSSSSFSSSAVKSIASWRVSSKNASGFRKNCILPHALCAMRTKCRCPRMPGTSFVPGSAGRSGYPWPPVFLWRFACRFFPGPGKPGWPKAFYFSP